MNERERQKKVRSAIEDIRRKTGHTPTEVRFREVGGKDVAKFMRSVKKMGKSTKKMGMRVG